MKNYFKELEDKVKVCYSVASQAREKGLDFLSKVEVPLATSLAERVTGLISTLYPQLSDPSVPKRILELEKKFGALDPAVALQIAEEIAREKFCKFQSLLEAIDAGIRIGIAYMTLGVVSSPIEGFTNLKLKKTRNGEDYFSAFFSGPIRSAGGTAAAFSLVIIDHLREIFNFAKYDPTEEEIKRTITELYDYHERVTNLQYLPTEEEIEFLARNLPIQVEGEPSENKEVSNYKDLERVETNFIRSGFCLVLGEGLAQKAPKILRMITGLREKGFKLSSWEFLHEYIKIHEKREKGGKKDSPTYIQDLVAGRPVLGHPSKSGAFRLIYGRARNSGYSALSIHPATMVILDGFVAIGTQLKIELPTKGAAITSCDSIDGPIVKLNNGSVKKIKTIEEAKELKNKIEEIIYLGDILIPYGDFANRNHVLMPEGYEEKWWLAEIKEKGEKPSKSFEERLKLSEKGIPLHPDYIFYWSQINYDNFLAFLDWLSHSQIKEGKLIFPYNRTEQERFKTGKRALELLGVEHTVTVENVVLNEQDSRSLLLNLGIEINGGANLAEEVEKIVGKIKQQKNVLDIINQLCKYVVKDKAGTFIGARMGRPEKAKLRKLVGSPNVLFPVGQEGGRLRSVLDACNFGSVKADFPIYYCRKCQQETIYYICETCGEKTEKLNYCPECQQKFTKERCPHHNIGQSFSSRRIDIKHFFDAAVRKLGFEKNEIPTLIKGVRGTSSKDHVPENLAKGILRAKYGLNVNKDGTIRFDATELPLTHFKPKEISVSIEKLKKLGYTRDIKGKELKDEEQVLELKPHDIILPSCPESLDEKADDVFLRISKFIDALLERFYGLKSFYNAKDKEDLVGHLVACIAPHNCASVVGRIIGFSKTQSLLASPYIHAACRRDCDGDEIAVMLLLDLLINFSRHYLPAHRGGTQDAPLVLNARIRAGEVDDMIFDVDVVKEYPFVLYKAGEIFEKPNKVKIEQIRNRLNNEEFSNLHYTHEVSDINAGVLCSSYKKLTTMQEKVEKQMQLVEKIRAVDTGDVARLVIDRHFIRDIKGNLRKFSQQEFRCVKCNKKYRRPPLSGKCLKCQGRIIFTISEGGIIKYLEPALSLAENYEVPAYVKQNLELTKKYIESIFGKETEKQEALGKWFN